MKKIDKQKPSNRLSPKIVAGIVVALFFGVALYLRAILPYDQLFVGDWIKLSGNDAYYHMHIVDNLVRNFPHFNSFDPYLIHPGIEVGSHNLFQYLLAGIIWLVGFGSPTQHTIDVVGVYFPAILGALTIIPVYFIGRALFNRWVGAVAAGLVAIFPGEFLGRSILGFTDYHVAETLFTTVSLLFLILAIKSGKDEMTFERLKNKAITYSFLAGIFLGIYFLTWSGALLFIFIIFIYFVVQFISDHLRSKSTDYLCIVGVVTLVTALLVSLFGSIDTMALASLIFAIVASVGLVGLSHFMVKRSIKPLFYPVAILGFGLVALASLQIIAPSFLESMVTSVLSIFVWFMGTTVLEMRPFLFLGDDFSWMIAWGNFTTGFFLGFISLCILIYFGIKRGESDKILFVVWSLVILAATLAMRRFAYYLVINIALLTGYFSWLILRFSGVGESGKKVKRKQGNFRLVSKYGNLALGIIVVFFLIFYPNIGPMPRIGALPAGSKLAIDTTSRVQFAPTNGWCESMDWLRENTPEPFGDAEFYYERYEEDLTPECSYGVTAWWDYGYLITRIGHRVPSVNPGKGPTSRVARLFIAQSESPADEIMDELDSRYVIVDYDIAVVTPYSSKFHAIATLGGTSKEEFYDIYGYQQEEQIVPVLLFYPEYYRSLIVRLYNFDGEEVPEQNTLVISYEGRIGNVGQPYNFILTVESLSSYNEALAYVASKDSGNYKIVSDNPFVSPVPLEALERYELIYGSPSSRATPTGTPVSEVKIFEYNGGK